MTQTVGGAVGCLAGGGRGRGSGSGRGPEKGYQGEETLFLHLCAFGYLLPGAYLRSLALSPLQMLIPLSSPNPGLAASFHILTPTPRLDGREAF